MQNTPHQSPNVRLQSLRPGWKQSKNRLHIQGASMYAMTHFRNLLFHAIALNAAVQQAA